MDCSWIGWCVMKPEVQAAWAQAILSVVGIGVAILVPAIQHGIFLRSSRLAHELRAKALGLSLRSEIDTMGTRLNVVWDREHPDEQADLHGNPNTRELGAGTMDALVISPTLESKIDVLHEMGSAGESTLRCIHDLHRARDLVTNQMRDGIAHAITFDARRFYDYLWDATQATADAINRIDDHFPVAPRQADGR